VRAGVRACVRVHMKRRFFYDTESQYRYMKI